ncbi:MAG: glycine cleavage system protein GcvH [Candidatus Thalassarchaeum sp.]|jgi:glycine cleavage system H protein|nr:glycine cleavage system protein GcvH [Candidatus Thalassarchaeum sp.]HJM23760.1 glycine cleavage system protein GcvH [Candidatus Thalassarchaeum sp.]|tara:strand:+ start:5595 stop:5978 length:384 start_codon:yes stop_codon:yes gene_type:complete
MSEVPTNLHYTETHEWVRIEENVLFVGITDFAQEALTEVVWVDLAEVGTTVQALGACASVESVKSVSEINSPVSGEIIKSNTALEDNPEMINEDPYGDGWIFKLRPTDVSDIGELLDAAAYTALIGE